MDFNSWHSNVLGESLTSPPHVQLVVFLPHYIFDPDVLKGDTGQLSMVRNLHYQSLWLQYVNTTDLFGIQMVLASSPNLEVFHFRDRILTGSIPVSVAGNNNAYHYLP